MDSTIQKIRKLLALSKSPNEHEALAAMEMASSLALKHNIDLLNLQTSKFDYKDHSIQDSTKIERWVSNIVSGLCRINACKHYIEHDLTNHLVNYRVVGKPLNVQVVTELTVYLTQTVKRLNREYVSKHSLDSNERSHYRKAFRLAASQRIYQRCLDRLADLITPQPSNPLSQNSLVVSDYYEQERRNIEEFLQNVDFKKARETNQSLRSSIGYHDGIQAANNINLGDQIHGVRNSRQIR